MNLLNFILLLVLAFSNNPAVECMPNGDYLLMNAIKKVLQENVEQKMAEMKIGKIARCIAIDFFAIILLIVLF